MDDLSFEEDESDYKFLKAVIEGGVETKPDNILIYATSNRRHIIRETWKDRRDVEQDGDIPNKFRIVGYSGQNYKIDNFSIYVLLEHKDLSTISPTKMNIFEDLARADVATLLCNLKYYDGFETIFATIDLKINDLETEAGKRDEIIQKLDDAHVTFSNTNQPMILVQ